MCCGMLGWLSSYFHFSLLLFLCLILVSVEVSCSDFASLGLFEVQVLRMGQKWEGYGYDMELFLWWYWRLDAVGKAFLDETRDTGRAKVGSAERWT